jgi:hypothetical protein
MVVIVEHQSDHSGESKRSRNATLAKSIIKICTCILLLYFITCHPVSSRGHRYIIVVIDYFTKWEKAIMTFSNDGETTKLFVFNQVISRLEVPREIVTDHGSHFQNRMMSELASKLGFRQENSSPYYPQENGQVEVVNKSLKTILKRIVNTTKSN